MKKPDSYSIIHPILVLIAVVIIGIASYGGWKLERWIHWRFGYEADVKKEIDSELEQVKEELQELKARVVELEKNRN